MRKYVYGLGIILYFVVLFFFVGFKIYQRNLVSRDDTVQATDIWIGHPMISDNDPYTPGSGWLPNHQIGFREDGVVIWRRVKEKNSHWEDEEAE